MKALTIQYILWAIGLSLQYLVLSAMSFGAWRNYAIAAAYVLILLVTTLTDIAAKLFIDAKETWTLYYWTAELVRQTAMLAVVVDLGVRMLTQARARRAGVLTLLAASIAFWSGSLLWLYHPDLNEWMTRVVRNLSFGTAILNLGLWFRLISWERRDPRDLALAGGLGLQMTGEAMGQSIRNLVPSLAFGGYLIVVFGHFLCMLVWWQAFARKEKPTAHA